MALPKRTSQSAKAANDRAAKLKAVDPALDLGDGNTLAAFNTKIKTVQTANDDYNTAKSNLDGQLNALEALEKGLDTMSSNLLAGVKIRYGKDSSEYEKAGGTRASERKKSVRKPKPPTS